MSLNWLLIWTIAISCGYLLLNLIQHRIRSIIFYLPALLVLSTLAVTGYFRQDLAGYYAGGVWFLLILLPGIAGQTSSNLLSSRRYRSASLCAWLAYLLHPYGGTRDQPRLVKAMRLLNSNQDAAAIEILETLRYRTSPAGRAAFVILTRIQNDWQGFLNAIHFSPTPQKFLSDPLLASVYLQALGETGQTEQLLSSFEPIVRKSKTTRSPYMLYVSRMKVAAFCGRVNVVSQLLDGPLRYFEAATQRYWIATAYQASNQTERANAIFAELSQCKDRQIAISAIHRLTTPVRPVSTLPPEIVDSPLFDDLEQSLQHESRFALAYGSSTSQPVATWGLVAILFLVFGFEMFNGEIGRVVIESTTLSGFQKIQLLLANTTNNQNLFEMGALVLPDELYPDAEWRVFRAAFLHFGLIHLLMNVAGLWIFGQRLEEAWGAWLTATSYLTCAILSIYLMTVIPLGATAENPYVLVGASGGVMGLIGCQLGYVGWGQLLRKNLVVGREFKLLFTIVIAQMIFDQSTPEVSSECHLLGLLIGTVLGVTVGILRSSLNRSPALVSPQAGTEPL